MQAVVHSRNRSPFLYVDAVYKVATSVVTLTTSKQRDSFRRLAKIRS